MIYLLVLFPATALFVSGYVALSLAGRLKVGCEPLGNTGYWASR
jgi:hypothetical protein